MKKVLVIFASIAAVTFSACATTDYVMDAPERVKAADWSRTVDVTVVLNEYAFSPNSLVFQKNMPYKLTIRNSGTIKHYFTAEKFFKNIATRKAQDSDAEFKAPYFSAIEIFPGHAVDLYFIPITPGTYELVCTIAGHADSGMTGEIKIE